MKKKRVLLIALVMSSPVFAAPAALHAPVRVVSCDPGSCFTETGSGYDLSQGLVGYDRQVQRIMRQVNEVGSANAVHLSVRAR